MSTMDEGDLARLEAIVNSLPPEDQEVVRRYQQTMYQNSVRAAFSAIMARNFSHGIGRYVLQCLG